MTPDGAVWVYGYRPRSLFEGNVRMFTKNPSQDHGDALAGSCLGHEKGDGHPALHSKIKRIQVTVEDSSSLGQAWIKPVQPALLATRVAGGCRTSWSLTEPSTARLRPPRPLEPTAIRSAEKDAASFKICSTGCP